MADNTPIVNTRQGDSHDMPHAMQSLLRNFQIDDDRLVPARVVSYDRVRNVAVVQPLVMWVSQDDTTRAPHQIANIPVLSLGGGGFHISFPLANGDLGWIHAADRDLDLFKQSLSMSAPTTGRMHSFSDGLFIPDVFRKYAIAAEDSAAMVLQSTDGSTKISIRNGDILIAATTKLVVRVPDTEFDGNVTVTGMTTVNGGFDASSSSGNAPCVLPQSTTIDSIPVIGHGHEEQGTSGRTAGGMIP